MRRSLPLLPLICLAIVAMPCMPVTTDASLVPVASEQALIAWDPASKIEYFIRQADFDGNGQPFGFLVPTPTKPELSKASAHLFEGLRAAIAPKIVRKPRYGLRFGWIEDPEAPKFAHEVMGATAGGVGTSGGMPEVLNEESIAGFDIVSLRATDAAGLSAWLGKNGFIRSKMLEDWLKPYIERKWIITAFKIKDGTRLQPVCMAFQTDRPFYPYKEPASKATRKGRLLRVYFLSDQRYDGSLQGKKWDVAVPFSAELQRYETMFLGSLEIAHQIESLHRLTAFEDRSNPRNGIEDVFFHAGNQDTVRPPPTIHVDDQRLFIRVTVWGPAILIAIYYGVKWYRRRKAEEAV